MIKLKHLKFNFTNDEGKGQMPVRNKLKKIRLLSQSSSSSMILNLPKVKRGKFLFGDLKGFVEKVNRLHRVIVLKRVCNEYKEYNNTVRNKSVFIRDNNISMLKYKQSLQRAYDVFKMEYEYKRRLKILRIYKLIQLITRKHIIHKLHEKYIRYMISIRRIQRTYKHYMKKKKEKIFIVRIQSKYRKHLIQCKYKKEIKSIKEDIKFNKRKKEFEKRMSLMKQQKKAVRVIEIHWLKILAKRDNEDLEERIKKMPKECRDLYRKFMTLRKQTRQLKRDLNEYNEEQKKKLLNSTVNS